MKVNAAGLRIIEIYDDEYDQEEITISEMAIELLVIPELNGNEFSSIASFCSSIGVDEFKKSKFLKAINRTFKTRKDKEKVAKLMEEYIYSKNDNGRLTKDRILKSRREEEIALFLRPVLTLVKGG